ncbi:MAG TPA: hypothetical protein VGV15_10860, partial [Terriglobales bacterium]|nr:hypothetical protein [Terriglobales bacterium]
MIQQPANLLSGILACVLLVPAASAWQSTTNGRVASPTPAPPVRTSFKEQIVFVRADPSMGVAST